MTPLPKKTKAAYGAAEMGITAIELFIQVYLLDFYTDTYGLSPGTAGVMLSLAVIWDAVSDPLMGRISDQTRFASGKRRPYIWSGALFLAASFLLLFNPPDLTGETAKAAYLLMAYLLVNTGMTIIAVPHTALAGELSRDLDERTELFGWRFLFANLGLMAGILLPGAFSSLAGETTIAAAMGPASSAVAVLLIVTAMISFWGTHNRDRPGTATASTMRGFLPALKQVLQNRVFLPLLAAFIIGSMGRTINSSIALFYYEYRLALNEVTVFLKILLPFTFVIALSIVGWYAISKRHGKKIPAVIGILFLGIYTCVSYPLFPTGVVWWPMIGGMVGGILIGAIFLLDSAVADVVDGDELESGEHREGLYFGVWRMGTKMARALGLALSGFLLEWIGFDNKADQQGEATEWGLALVFGPGVGIFFILAGLVLLAYPLDRAKSEAIRAELDARRDAD